MRHSPRIQLVSPLRYGRTGVLVGDHVCIAPVAETTQGPQSVSEWGVNTGGIVPVDDLRLPPSAYTYTLLDRPDLSRAVLSPTGDISPDRPGSYPCVISRGDLKWPVVELVVFDKDVMRHTSGGDVPTVRRVANSIARNWERVEHRSRQELLLFAATGRCPTSFDVARYGGTLPMRELPPPPPRTQHAQGATGR